MKKLFKSAIAGLALASAFAFAPIAAQASPTYTECGWYNSSWDVCTTYASNWDTGLWDAVDSYFVYTGDNATIDP